jgi:hypothetical protein
MTLVEVWWILAIAFEVSFQMYISQTSFDVGYYNLIFSYIGAGASNGIGTLLKLQMLNGLLKY